MEYEFTIEQAANNTTIVTKQEGDLTSIEIIPAQDHFQIRQGPGGQYLTTPGARELPRQDVEEALRRYHSQDWGDNIHPQDNQSNSRNHRRGQGLILAEYQSQQTKFWIHQQPPKPPTVMLPAEY